MSAALRSSGHVPRRAASRGAERQVHRGRHGAGVRHAHLVPRARQQPRERAPAARRAQRAGEVAELRMARHAPQRVLAQLQGLLRERLTDAEQLCGARPPALPAAQAGVSAAASQLAQRAHQSISLLRASCCTWSLILTFTRCAAAPDSRRAAKASRSNVHCRRIAGVRMRPAAGEAAQAARCNCVGAHKLPRCSRCARESWRDCRRSRLSPATPAHHVRQRRCSYDVRQ